HPRLLSVPTRRSSDLERADLPGLPAPFPPPHGHSACRISGSSPLSAPLPPVFSRQPRPGPQRPAEPSPRSQSLSRLPHPRQPNRSEEHTSELQSRFDL